MDIEKWLLELEWIVKSHNSLACNLNEWREWDNWNAYFETGKTPKEAYALSMEESPTQDSKVTGERMFGDNFGTLTR